MKEEVIQKILDNKIIAIVRGIYGEECMKLAQALYAGGISLLEVTFDQSAPDAMERTSETIRMLNEQKNPDLLIGAGTVTTIEMLQFAKQAGAQFIISPNTDEEIIRKTTEEGLVSIPGAMTPSEILKAHKCGADFVKLFPAADFGPSYLKAVRAPLNHIRMLAVGGINENNLCQFLRAGAVGVGVGGNLVSKKWIAEGKFDQITALAAEFVRNAQGDGF